MELTEKIRSHWNIPLVIHMMDDWPASTYRNGLFSKLERRKMERLLNHLMSVAQVRMSICDEMSQAYEKRYGASFLSFQNTLDTQTWHPYVKKTLEIGNKIHILYIGSILPLVQLKSLADCCRAVVELKKQNLDACLEIYSPSPLTQKQKRELLLGDCITFKDTITDNIDFFKKLAQADILLLPVNFDKKTVQYIRYSMPTKVPAYLLSGTPVLVYGPSETAQAKYAQKDKWGYIVDQRGIDQLKQAMQTLIADKSLREKLSSQAQIVASKNHDVAKVRKLFQQTLCGSINL